MKRISLAIFLFFASSPNAWAGVDEVVQILSVRDSSHGQLDPQYLADLAGGEDALVEILLEYRTKEQPPFVGIRAEKLLLANYADRTEVIDALEEDVKNPNLFGLARTISTHLETSKDAAVRNRLAKAIIARASSEERFKRYARQLEQSSDESVARLAKEARD